MIGAFERVLTDNPEETVFLPTVILGYVYARYESLTTCTFQPLAEILVFGYGGFSRPTYLLATIAAAIGGSVFYYLLREADNADESFQEALEGLAKGNSIPKLLLMALIVVPFLPIFYLTPIELVLRYCNSNIVIVGGIAAYLVLFTVANAERLVD